MKIKEVDEFGQCLECGSKQQDGHEIYELNFGLGQHTHSIQLCRKCAETLDWTIVRQIYLRGFGGKKNGN